VKHAWLHRNNRKTLIVFCNGWGMDEHPFLPLTADHFDVLMLCDYFQLDFDIQKRNILEKYDHLILVGWSMGVWAGQRIFSDNSEVFSRTIAINGTLCPINDRLGIPEKVFGDTLAGFGEPVRSSFYRRMCRGKTNLKLFLSHQPQRSLKSQQQELTALRQNVDCFFVKKSIYNEIIITENDQIMPSANQLRFWQEGDVYHIPGSHFVFYIWQSWDELLAFHEVHSKKLRRAGKE